MPTRAAPAEGTKPRGPHRRLLGPAIFLVALLLYLPSVATGTFVLDDVAQVLGNRAVREADVPAALLEGYWANTSREGRVADARGDLWRPVTTLSVLVSFALWGETAWPYHLENVLLHALAAWLAFHWARRLLSSDVAAAVAGMAFAVAPIHVEAVCGVILRNELIAAVFGLAYLILIARGRPLTAAGCLLVALGAKESAIALPFAAWLADHVFALDAQGSSPGEPRARRWLRRHAPALVALVLYLGARFAVLGQLGLAEGHGIQHFHGQPWLVVWLTMARFAFEHYLVPALLGWPLVFDFSYATFEHVAPTDVLAWLLLAAFVSIGLGSLAWAIRRRSPIAFGLALAALLVAPTSNVLVRIGVLGAHRLFYVPYLGLALVLGLLAERALGRARTRRARGLLAGGALAVLVGYGFQSVHGQLAWRDERTFWEDVQAKSPHRIDGHGANALGWANLCSLELEELSNRRMTQGEFRERLERAYEYGERALAIDPARTWGSVAEPLALTGYELGRLDAFVARIDTVLAAKRAGRALPAEIAQIEGLQRVLATVAATQRDLLALQRVPVPTRATVTSALRTIRRALACFPAPLPATPPGFEGGDPDPPARLPDALGRRLQRIRRDLEQTHDRLVRAFATLG